MRGKENPLVDRFVCRIARASAGAKMPVERVFAARDAHGRWAGGRVPSYATCRVSIRGRAAIRLSVYLGIELILE